MADCLAHMEWSRYVPNMGYPRQGQEGLLRRMEESRRAGWDSRQNEGWQVGSNTEHVALQWGTAGDGEPRCMCGAGIKPRALYMLGERSANQAPVTAPGLTGSTISQEGYPGVPSLKHIGL